MKPFSCILSIAFIVCLTATAKENNPFIPMTHKPYAEYADSLERYNPHIVDEGAEWAVRTAAQMREAAKASGDRRWELEAEFFEFLYPYQRVWDKPEREKRSQETLDFAQSIIERARQMGYTALQLRGEFFVFTHFWYDLQNHELAFRQWNRLEKALDPVPVEKFPFKSYYYQRIGELYGYFGEFEKQEYYYRKAMETPEVLLKQGNLEWIINELGLIYRYQYDDLDRSDSCFRAIIELPNELRSNKSYPNFTFNERKELWIALAKGNLGTNQYLRGNYDEAIPLIMEGM